MSYLAGLDDQARLHQWMWTGASEQMVLARMVFGKDGSPVDCLVEDVNPAFSEQTGIPREQAAGRSARELLPGWDPEWVRRCAERLEAGRRSVSLEYDALRNRWHEVQVIPAGSRGRFVAIARDMTDTVALSATGVFEVDFRSKRLTAVNDVVCEMTGYSREELLRMNPIEILDDAGRKTFEQRIALWLEGETPSTKVDYRIIAKDGREIYVLLDVDIKQDSDGRPRGAVVVAYDITERKKIEATLKENQVRLAAELEAAEALHNLSTELIQANDVDSLCDHILITVIRILHADKGTIQLYHPEHGPGGALMLYRTYGFDGFDIRSWKWVGPDAKTSCGEVQRRRVRVAIPDVLKSDLMAGGTYLQDYLRMDIRSVQTTPLLSRTGALLGVFSTYWRQPRQLTASEVRSLDVVARQAADLVDRTQTEAALRESERRLQDSQEQYRGLYEMAESRVGELDAIIAAFADGLTIYDAAGSIVYQNRVAREGSVSCEGDSTRIDGPLQLSLRKGETVRDFVMARPTIPETFTSVTSAPTRNSKGEITGAVVLHRDITEQKRTEAELRRSRQEALDLVKRLRQVDENRMAFLATLSHELRNPLAAIAVSNSLLRSLPASGEAEARARHVIERQTAQLSRLVDDLLDVSRITRNKLTLKRQVAELNTVVRAAVEDYGAVLATAGVELVTILDATPAYLEADPVRLTQAIGNLLSNAAKFTPRGGTATVTVTTDQSRQEAVITVQDTGIGIDADVLPRLFQPFTQADASYERTNGGLGLGLALVRGIAELHGGSVSAGSGGPGKGSAFTIRLPLLVGGDAGREVAAAREIAAPASMSILVIEDNRDFADIICAFLEMLGHAAAAAASGPDGIAKAREVRPDVILCDIGMPGMDGYEVARQLRAEEGFREEALLVAMSGYAQPDDIERAYRAGFDHHLAKPVDLSALGRLLAEWRKPAAGRTM